MQNAPWINRLFIDLANRNNRFCVITDCSGINKDGPGRFQTEAGNLEFQTCYFNSANDKQVYNVFVSKRKKSAEDSKNFHFKMIKFKSKTNKNVTFDAADKLSDLTKIDTATNRSDKKRAQSVFGSGNVKPISRDGTSANELAVSSDQAYARPRKRIRPVFLP